MTPLKLDVLGQPEQISADLSCPGQSFFAKQRWQVLKQFNLFFNNDPNKTSGQ